MEMKTKTKKEIVKMLLKQEIPETDEADLIEMLIDRPIAIDVDKQEDSTLTKGDKMADKLSEIAGSWTFIICFGLFLLTWIIINTVILSNSGADPYPFILLNLLLSCLAAIQAPVIMMSQNRQAKKDSIRNQNDYQVDLKSEIILEDLHDKINVVLKNQREIIRLLSNDSQLDTSKKTNNN